MPQVVFLQSAIRDIERLRAFLRQQNAAAAQRAGEAIVKGGGVLAANPLAGRAVDGLPDLFRDWLIRFGKSGYVVLYTVDGGTVVVLAVRHFKEIGFRE